MCIPSPIVKKYSYWTYRNYGDGMPCAKTSNTASDKTQIQFQHLYHNDAALETMNVDKFLKEFKWLSSD